MLLSRMGKLTFCFGLWSSLCLSVLTAGCTTAQELVQVNKAESPAAAVEGDSDSSGAGSIPTASIITEEEMLWQKLAQADEETYVVLLRHAVAPGTGDPITFQLDECSTQRNLSEAGRQQARDMGEAFRRRDIPVTHIFSSQWCRCLETAELLNLGTVQPFPALNSFFRDRSTEDAQTTQVKDYVAAYSDSPGVIVMVTHQVNITALSSLFPQSGSAVVVQLEDGQLEVLGQLLALGS